MKEESCRQLPFPFEQNKMKKLKVIYIYVFHRFMQGFEKWLIKWLK